MPSLCEQQLHRLRSLQDEQYLCLSNLEHLEHNLQTMSDAVRCRSFCASCITVHQRTLRNHVIRVGIWLLCILYASTKPDWQAEALRQLPICSSVCSFVRYETCEHNILKTNDPILMPSGTSGPWGKGMKRSTSGVRRSRKTEDRFGGLAEASSRPSWVE